MSVQVFTDGYITVAGTNLSARCTEIKVDDGFDEIEAKAMSNTAGNTVVGMAKQQIQASFMQDFSAGSVHATLQAAKGTGVAIEVRPTSGARSTTNPGWTGTLLLAQYSPIGAKVGDKYVVTAIFKTQGVAIAYQTS